MHYSSTHMQDLKDVTADVHYENFRAQHIFESMAGQQKERRYLFENNLSFVFLFSMYIYRDHHIK